MTPCVAGGEKMGQLHLRKTLLEDVVARSRAVLVVTPLVPDHRVEVVPVEGAKDGEFQRVRWRYRVDEVLFGGPGAPQAGEEVAVDTAQWRKHFDLHRRYVLEGLSRHVVVESYEPARPPAPGSACIVFLTHTPDGWQSTVMGALEGLASRDDVLAALRRR